MKIYKRGITLLFIIAFGINVFGQTKPYPFNVEKTGKGEQAIIFIPGFSCSGEVWKATSVNYEKNYTCYTLTMAGFAGEKPQETITFEYWKNQIADYIKSNDIKKPIIIGHSLGGGLALAIAADYPKLVQKIVVVDALPCLVAMMNPAFESVDSNDCSEIVNQIVNMDDKQFYQMQQRSILSLLADTSMHETVINWSVKSDRTTFAKMYCDFSNTDLRERIARIECPTLVLLESYFVNFKPTIEAQYKKLKTADLEYANKGLHFIMYDDKDWYFSQLNHFIIGQ